VAEQHRRLAEHRKTLYGALANQMFAHGADIACEKLDYVAWQKNFPRSVRDRAPGLLVEMMRRKVESPGGDRLYEYNPTTTALSQTCLCGNRKKKPLSQRIHRCRCGINEDRDVFSAYLGLHVRRQADGSDRLDLQAANHGWLHRHDVDGLPRTGRTASLNRRDRRHPPSRRSVAHQSPQGRETTEPVGANFHHQPAHGVAHTSNETAGAHSGTHLRILCEEDVKMRIPAYLPYDLRDVDGEW
jgi:hypothetical protein